MYLSNAVLGKFIAKCLFGKKWKDMEKFVIPRKGNFVNPQQISDTDTYAIYYIEKKRKTESDENRLSNDRTAKEKWSRVDATTIH